MCKRDRVHESSSYGMVCCLRSLLWYSNGIADKQASLKLQCFSAYPRLEKSGRPSSASYRPPISVSGEPSASS
jgi:hypothetical protein